MEKGRPSSVMGWKEKLQTVAIRLAPRRVCVLESRKYFRPKPPAPDAKTIPAAAGTAAEPATDDAVRRAG